MGYLLNIVMIIGTVLLAIALGDLIAIGPYKKVEPEKQSGEGEKSLPMGVEKVARIIRTQSFVEKQEGPSCGGFAAAYALRHFGVEAKGQDIYGEMFKIFKGNVHIREVKKALKKRGIISTLCKGSIETLKEEIDKGYPVILWVRSKPKSWDYHFFVAVGYDTEYNIYIADSAYAPKTMKMDIFQGIPPYNRVIPKDYFLEIWDTACFFMPTYKNIYLIIRREGSEVLGEMAK